MGLFNNFVRKASRIVTNAVEDKIFDDFKNSVQNTFNGNTNTNSNNSNFQNYTIPEKYSCFPKYEGNIVERPIEKETNNYNRITIKYSGSPSHQFISALLQSGFVQASSVRYDKNNTYVIVDNLGNKTEIVYHIKK